MSSVMPITRSVREYLAAIGRKGGKLGGKARTPAKSEAAKANGKKGGRPRKSKKSNGNKSR